MIDFVINGLVHGLNMLQGKGWGSATTEQEVRLALSQLRNPEVVVDVGGNVGNWTAALLAHSKPKRVYVFEPSKKNQLILAERFDGNAQVVVVPNALSDKEVAATLFGNAPGSGLASLHRRNLGHLGVPFEALEEIKTMSVANFLSDFKISKIDILKLDIEGHELTVLTAVQLSA